MDRIVRFVRATYQKIGVQYVRIKEFDLIWSNRVHVMNEDTTIDFVPLKTKIAAIIARYDLIPDSSPLGGLVKTLIQITVEPERLITNVTADSQVIVPIFDSVKKNKDVIALYHFYYSHTIA